LSQLALADLAGIGKTSVFDVESGKPTVRLTTLKAVLDVLNVDLILDGPIMDECQAELAQSSRNQKP